LEEQEVDSGMGSGFVFDAEQGLVLTNAHVVEGAASVRVELSDERTVEARNRGIDPLTDVAILQISASGLSALPLGDSDATRVGDWVLALGNPFGLSHTVSAGIISGRDRTDVELSNPRAYFSFLQTDAAINPGNSGGPLIDLGGRVVGINSAIRAGANTIGFAVPINMVREIVPRLLEKGRMERAVIGVQVSNVPSTHHGGALIGVVIPETPAAEAGFLPGDIALRVGDHVIDGPERFRWWVSLAEIGKPLSVVVRRGDGEKTLVVKPWPSER
jgi:serine protease Do